MAPSSLRIVNDHLYRLIYRPFNIAEEPSQPPSRA